ncbi:MAG: SMC-Scp complex subunit ScpB [Candidatus Liptonbacteria bacterium]|nr:SMC-Scp complex subunit ScpB [Candidatus Liptonbacteria bacterium]
MNEPNQKLAALEALLFIHGEPMSVKKIGEVLKLGKDETSAVISEFEKLLSSEDRGLELLSTGDRVQLRTKPSLNSALEEFVKAELSEELSPASLEVLSLVAYLGPISRAKLEYIRGVNSSFILRSLMIRGLLDRHTDPENSLAYLYDASFGLLGHLGLKSAKDLPEYEKFKILLTEAESAPKPENEPEGVPNSEETQNEIPSETE